MLIVHTAFSLLSYVAFLVAFVSGVLFLLQERQLKRKRMGLLFHRLPSLGVLDRVNVAAIGIGFALLSVGLAYGLAAALLLRGRWWSGDPKELLAAALWGAYLGLWWLRLRGTLRGRRVAVLSIVGLSLVVFTLLGAQRLLPTWHAYL